MRLELEQAVELYELSVFRAAFYTCRDREEAEDVCQETFLAYFRNHDEFASREHVRAWLLRTAINKAKRAIRKAFEYNMAGKGSCLVEMVSTCNSGWKSHC